MTWGKREDSLSEGENVAHKEVSNQDDLNVSLDFVKIFDRALPLSSLCSEHFHTHLQTLSLPL